MQHSLTFIATGKDAEEMTENARKIITHYFGEASVDITIEAGALQPADGTIRVFQAEVTALKK